MRLRFYRTFLILLMGVALFEFVGCHNDDIGDFSDVNSDIQKFTPTEFQVRNFETRSLISWEASLFSDKEIDRYVTEVSEDSLFADEGNIALRKATDTTGVEYSDEELKVRQKYFVRVRADTLGQRKASNWSESQGFQITGVQLLRPVYNPDITFNSIVVRWDKERAEGITHLEVKEYEQSSPEEEPIFIGDGKKVDLDSEAIEKGNIVVDDLKKKTKYQVDLFKEGLNVGRINVETRNTTDFDIIIEPDDDLGKVIKNSKDGAIIGLEPGVYDGSDSNFQIYDKHITLMSTSSDPTNTKILFKEFTLKNSGAGLHINGIELDGQDEALYLINLTSDNSNSDFADFADITIENAIVHGVETSAFRTDRGPNSGYSLGSFEIKYSIFYDFVPSNYAFLHLDKLKFNSVSLNNSTFYNTGDLFIRYRQSMDDPSPSPKISIEYCTINSIGNSQNYPLIDAGTVSLDLNVKNTILSNVPRDGGSLSNTDLIKMKGEQGEAKFSFVNLYNLNNGADDEAEDLEIPNDQATVENIFEESLDWDNQTTNFSLPIDSKLQNAASDGGPIGDPRWWF